MRNKNLLKIHVSEIRVKRIRVNQGIGVTHYIPRLIQLNEESLDIEFFSKSTDQTFRLILLMRHRV